MIDEYWTWVFYGYHSDELKPFSTKTIIVRCDGCCQYKVSMMYQYRDLCRSCAQKKRLPFPQKHRDNLSKGNVGIKHKPFTRPPQTEETKRMISATRRGIPYDEWIGFATMGEYCEKFDEACKERIREKYNRLCYVCDKNEKDNGRKLNVHHIDMNKEQGCVGIQWKLVPLCNKCHGKSHFDPMQSRLQYLFLV